MESLTGSCIPCGFRGQVRLTGRTLPTPHH